MVFDQTAIGLIGKQAASQACHCERIGKPRQRRHQNGQHDCWKQMLDNLGFPKAGCLSSNQLSLSKVNRADNKVDELDARQEGPARCLVKIEMKGRREFLKDTATGALILGSQSKLGLAGVLDLHLETGKSEEDRYGTWPTGTATNDHAEDGANAVTEYRIRADRP